VFVRSNKLFPQSRLQILVIMSQTGNVFHVKWSLLRCKGQRDASAWYCDLLKHTNHYQCNNSVRCIWTRALNQGEKFSWREHFGYRRGAIQHSEKKLRNYSESGWDVDVNNSKKHPEKGKKSTENQENTKFQNVSWRGLDFCIYLTLGSARRRQWRH